MKLVSAVLVRNEAGPDRFFGRVLKRLTEFSDEIVVLDDRSTDGTPALARAYGASVVERESLTPAWGEESPARAQLWDVAASKCQGPHDWVLICDADQILVGDVRSLCLSREVNSWCVVLYDCWSETEYREDEFWRAHTNPRPWLFAPKRVPASWVPEWPGRGLHPGHCPVNFPLIPGIAPPDEFHWLHLGYSTQALRQQKYEQYMSKSHLLSPFEQAHVQSILQ